MVIAKNNLSTFKQLYFLAVRLVEEGRLEGRLHGLGQRYDLHLHVMRSETERIFNVNSVNPRITSSDSTFEESTCGKNLENVLEGSSIMDNRKNEGETPGENPEESFNSCDESFATEAGGEFDGESQNGIEETDFKGQEVAPPMTREKITNAEPPSALKDNSGFFSKMRQEK